MYVTRLTIINLRNYTNKICKILGEYLTFLGRNNPN